jgi:lipopolysaccharide export system permease protein
VFLTLTGMLIPSFVAVILPITTYVVVQFVYQRLAGDRELTVMRAAGLGPWGIARPALIMTLMVMLCSAALNIWIVPDAFAAFRQYQFEIRNKMAAFLLQEGVFTPVSDDLTVYVRKRDADGTLHGILIDDARAKNSHATILAERGRLVSGLNGTPTVLLENGSRQEIDHQTGRLNMLTFKQNEIDLADQTRTDSARVQDMAELPLSALLDPHPWNPRDVPKWLAEGHKRLASPLTALSYGLIALLFVLTGTFRRHGGIVRPLAAVSVVVVLLAVGLAIGNMAARDTALLPLIWIHAALPGIVAGWLLLGPGFPRRRSSARQAASAA